MSHMQPPDDERDYNIGDKVKEVNRSSSIKFFTGLVILMGIIILVMIAINYLGKQTDNKSMGDNPYSDTSGGSLGGAMGGGEDDDGMPTPESISREMKGGGGMKVLISSPEGDRVIEVSPEQMKALSKPVGGDATEASPVGGD